MTMPDIDNARKREVITLSPDVAISFRDVSKSYNLYVNQTERILDQSGLARVAFWRKQPAYQKFHALKGVHLEIGHGERVGLIGRNGAGKTTLLKLITDNFVPTSGELIVNGSVQALMQLGIGFYPEFSGYENIVSSLSYNGLSGVELEEAIHDVVDFVELKEFLHQPMKTYSLGMNARVQFAAATAIRPDILLIDEILGAGDAYFAAKSALRMEKLALSGCTIILVSHSWQQIQQYCHRVVWLKDGAVHMDGKPAEILAAYEVHISEETNKARNLPRVLAESISAEATIESVTGDASSNVSEENSAESDNAAEHVEGEQGVDYATVDWVANRLRSKEHITASAEYEDRLEGGLRVFRVAGIPGLRFYRVAVTSNGKRASVVGTGDPLKIDLRLIADRSDQFVCTYWIHFFTIDGRRVCRVESAPDRFGAEKGGYHDVSVDMSPLILGGGEYLISFSVFDVSSSDSAADTLNARFEMLARSYSLRIVSGGDSDPPIVHYPGSWRFADATTIVPSVLRSGT